MMNPESVGFTGTRHDLESLEQLRVSGVVLALPKDTRIVTGACVGLDAFVARVASDHLYPVHTIVPADRSRVDQNWYLHCDTYFEEVGTTYRDRNIRIVAESDRVIAFPDHAEDAPESRRSGTWQTVKLARKAGKPVEIHILCAVCRRPTQGEAPNA